MNNMELTYEIQAKVVAEYFGCSIAIHGKPDVGIVYGSTLDSIRKYGIGNGELLLMLKPLTKLTAEDAIEIAKMLYPEYGNKEYNWTERVGRFYIEHIFTNRKSAVMKAEIYQFLQGQWYDLPNYWLEGKTLQEAGLAIYE